MNLESLKNDQRMPKHIGLIIDGNGRWAKRRGLKRIAGHKVGLENLKKHIEFIRNLGIKNLSIYCFSTENWNRPKEEVDYLMKELLENMLDEYSEKYRDEDVKILISGDLSDTRILPTIREKALNIMSNSKDKEGFVLNFCINYGGRQEILRAINQLLADGAKEVTAENLEGQLYSKDLLPLDFIIRSGGEQRTSNFMIWQSSYSEWSFPKTLWPSFSQKDLVKALKNYMKRNRRFGAIK